MRGTTLIDTSELPQAVATPSQEEFLNKGQVCAEEMNEKLGLMFCRKIYKKKKRCKGCFPYVANLC